MSHKNKKILDEVVEKLKGMQAFGEPRHLHKMEGETKDKIYSYNTFKTYKGKCCEFALYTKNEHKCKTLTQARQYVNEFLKLKIDKGYSPYTIKLYASALGKLFQEPTTNFINTPMRERCNITRSRNENCVRDKHFSYEKNHDLVEFCKSCGLRRSELESVRGKDLQIINGEYFVYVKGKGGKERLAPIIGNVDLVVKKFESVGANERVWGKVSSALDVHNLRSIYANTLYRQECRELKDIPRNERYWCRKELAHTCLDKYALGIVAKALGHSQDRGSIFAYSYYRK